MSEIYFDGSSGFYVESGRRDSAHFLQHHLRKLHRSYNKQVKTDGFSMLPWDTNDDKSSYASDDDLSTKSSASSSRRGSAVSMTMSPLSPMSPSSPADSDSLKVRLSKQDRKEKRKERRKSKSRSRLNKLQENIRHGSIVDVLRSSEDADNADPYYAKHKIREQYGRIMQLYNQPVGSKTSDFKLFQYNSVALYKMDLDYMLPEEWLNDNNISFVFEILNKTFIEPNPFSFEVQLLFPSLVQLFLHVPRDSNLEEILPLKDLKKSKFIFIPLNHTDDQSDSNLEEANNGDHWMLCVLCLLNNKLYVYDSMVEEEGDPADESHDKVLSELAARFQSCNSLFKKNTPPIEIVKMKCDQQDNSDDCGVFLIMITCVLIKRLFYGDRTDEEADEDDNPSDGDFNPSDYKVNLDIGNVKLDALEARLFMINLIYQMAQAEVDPEPVDQ